MAQRYKLFARVLLVAGAVMLSRSRISAEEFDWRESLARHIKEAKESCGKLFPCKLVTLRLWLDETLYQNVLQDCNAEIASITKQRDGTSLIVFGNLTKIPEGDFSYAGARVRKPFRPAILPASGLVSLSWKEINRPVPLAVGMKVGLGLGKDNTVRVFSYNASDLAAARQCKDGQWEELIQVAKCNDNRCRLLLIHADHTDVNKMGVWIEWNETYGLCKGYWSECGDEPAEGEPLPSGARGLPAANIPGYSVKPGRDGWISGENFLPNNSPMAKEGLIPVEQYLMDNC